MTHNSLKRRERIQEPLQVPAFPWMDSKSWSPVIQCEGSRSEWSETTGESKMPQGPGSSLLRSREGPAAIGQKGREIRKAGVVPSFLNTLSWILKWHEMQPKALFKDYFYFQCVSIREGGSPNISPVWSQFSLLPKLFGSRPTDAQEKGVLMIQSSKLHYLLN